MKPRVCLLVGKRQESSAGERTPERKISFGFLNIIINKIPAEILWLFACNNNNDGVFTSHPDSTDYNCIPKRKDRVQQSWH